MSGEEFLYRRVDEASGHGVTPINTYLPIVIGGTSEPSHRASIATVGQYERRLKEIPHHSPHFFKIYSKCFVLCSILFILTGTVCAEESVLIEVQKLNPNIRVDLRYTTADNFVGTPLYPEGSRCFLRKEAAEALVRVQAALEKQKLGLKIYDGYRPLSVQKLMWAKYPVEGYVANPAKGSNHNRGMAVDLTLVNAAGAELPMPSAFDEFSERAHRDYQKGKPEELKNRQILQDAMEKEGFRGISTEWWHFDYKDAKKYPVLDLPMTDL